MRPESKLGQEVLRIDEVLVVIEALESLILFAKYFLQDGRVLTDVEMSSLCLGHLFRLIFPSFT